MKSHLQSVHSKIKFSPIVTNKKKISSQEQLNLQLNENDTKTPIKTMCEVLNVHDIEYIISNIQNQCLMFTSELYSKDILPRNHIPEILSNIKNLTSL